MHHALLGLRFANEAHERFEFELEQALFRDRRGGAGVAATEDVRQLTADEHVVLRDLVVELHVCVQNQCIQIIFLTFVFLKVLLEAFLLLQE